MTRYEILIKIGDEKYYLDTFQYDPVSLNFDIANIKDISGRNSAYSKTIKLPDSQNNREVLGFITNLSVDSSVDANKAIKTWILVDTIPVFEGNLQLKKFQKNFKTGEFDIEVVVFADNDTFFTTIGEKYISDLDLSAYNHDWTADNIRFTWTQSTGFPYRYPLIDYGSNWNISDLNGLTFSGATQGTATQSLTVDEMFPAISRKIIFDRIFQEAGFNYDSEFLNSDYFKNEYIPFSGVKMPGRSDADQLTFKAAGTQSQIILTAPTSGGQSGITDEIIDAVDFEDTNNFWDSTNYWYENTTNDIISMSFDILVKYRMLLPQGATRIRVWSSLNADGSANANWAGGTGRLIASSLALYSNGSIISNTVLDPPDTYTSFYTTPYINIRSGEKVRFTLYALNQVYVPNLNFIELQLSNISNNINPFATVGSSLQISNLLPKKIKQRDFILSACREYNLYIEPSKEYQNTLIIEPRDDYYANGKIKDWTNKIDLNQSIEVNILAETQNKITTFSHKEDKDYLNQNYKQSFNEIYGQYDFDSGNEFAKSQNKKIESIFSPTPLNLVPDSVGLIIPLITKDTLFSYNVDSKGRLDTNIRTLQWGGLVEFNNDFDRVSFDGQYITKNGNFAYPYAGHLDNPYSPTVDNNFGDPIDVYFPNDGLTTNNLFNRFWYKTMLELTNKDSRILTANFYLTSEDIYNFRFNDKIYIFFDGSGQYYKVNKIFDFDPGVAKTTKVELLRTYEVQVNTFVAKFIGKGKGGVRVPPRDRIEVGKVQTEVLDTGNNNTIDGVQILTNGSSNDVSGVGILINGNNNVVEVSGTNQIVNGNRNQIDLGVSDSTIFGNDNKIGTYSEGVTIFGNRNEVYGASGSTPSNIFVIGNDIVATQSNTNYIGGNTIISGTISVDSPSFNLNCLQINNLNIVELDNSFLSNLGSGFDDGFGEVDVISVQSDGKILVGGSFTSFNGNSRNSLLRLNSNGSEDSSFYSNLGTGFNGQIFAIEAQSDGKILVGGSFTTLNGTTRRRLVRLNSDGSVDTSFYSNLGTGFSSTIFGIKIQSDGKILVGGIYTTLNGNTRNRLVRLNSDGTEDSSFYTNLGTGFNNNVVSINIQSDGKILVSGSFTGLNGNTRNRLVRLNSNGTEDSSFYTNLGTGFDNQVSKTQVQNDGKILAGGVFTSFNGNTRGRIVRLNSNGTEDSQFYTNIGGFTSDVNSFSIQSDNSIIIAGNVGSNFIVKANENGIIDNNFIRKILGINGTIFPNISLADNSILIGGLFGLVGGQVANQLAKLVYVEVCEYIDNSEFITIGNSQSIININGNVSGFPAADSIAYIEGGSGPFIEVDEFIIDSSPYIKIVANDQQPDYKSYIIGDSISNNIIENVDSTLDSNIILAGKNNRIGGDTLSRYNSIIGGEGNTISNIFGSSSTTAILGSKDSSIDNSGPSNQNELDFIIGGNDSHIQGSTQSFIIGAKGATISGLIRAGIIGVDNLVATQSDTIYLPNVRVMESISIDEVINLKPLSATPSNPVEGTIFYRESVGIRFYDGTTWRTLDFT